MSELQFHRWEPSQEEASRLVVDLMEGSSRVNRTCDHYLSKATNNFLPFKTDPVDADPDVKVFIFYTKGSELSKRHISPASIQDALSSRVIVKSNIIGGEVPIACPTEHDCDQMSER